MTTVERVQRPRRRQEEAPVEPQAAKKTPEQTKADLDAIIDEIDDVLENNAQAMVDGFIQKGGE